MIRSKALRQIPQKVSIRELVLLFGLVVSVFSLLVQINLLHWTHSRRKVELLHVDLGRLPVYGVLLHLRLLTLPVNTVVVIVE